MRTLKSIQRRSGFTLIEILLAIGILALGITAVLSLFMMARARIAGPPTAPRAALLADTVVNQIRTDLAETVPANRYREDPSTHDIWLRDVATGTDVTPANGNPAVLADFPEFRYYVTFAKLYPDGRDYYKVKVIVVWDTAGLVAPGVLDKRNSETFETIVRRKNY